jgi:mRNA interferase YafQ
MTRQIVLTNSFERDLKRIKKQGKKLAKLWDIVDQLVKGVSLHPKHRPHRLSGDWNDWWECHIEPDWLLIYDYSESEVLLARTGSHSELF